MKRASPLVALFLIFIPFGPGFVPAIPLPLPLPEEPVAYLVPATTRLRVYDPLFLKIVLANHSARDLLVEYSYTVYWRFRNIDEDGPWQLSRVGGECILGERFIPQRQQLAFHDILFVFAPLTQSPTGLYVSVLPWRPVFNSPGTYEIAATLCLSDADVIGLRQQYRTEPIRVHVAPLDSSERRKIENMSTAWRDGRHAIAYAFPTVRGMNNRNADDEVLRKIEPHLSDSLLKETVTWILAICDVRKAKTPSETKQSLERVNSLRKGMDTVTGEIADLLLASELLQKEMWDEAKIAVSRVKERSDIQKRLLWILSHH